MPYRRHEDFVAWNRDYQRKRSAGERKDLATIACMVCGLFSALDAVESCEKKDVQVRRASLLVEMPPRLALHAGESNPFARKLLHIEEEETA